MSLQHVYRSKCRVIRRRFVIIKMQPELKRKVDHGNSIAEDFIRLYYKHMDKIRHQIGKLYMDSAVLVWNGNGSSGTNDIQRFLLDLPASEHVIVTLDAQPIVDDTLAARPTFIIQATGNVQYQVATDTQNKLFQQTFVITVQEDKWKVVSDCFRSQGVAGRDQS